MQECSSTAAVIPERGSTQRRCCIFFTVCALLIVVGVTVRPLYAKDHWVELNIGPFRVDTDSDIARARQTLANLEQLRWILGGMLENQNLQAAWPFRVLITDNADADSSSFTLAHGEYVAAVRPGREPLYVEVARLLLVENTPRLPPEVDSALPLLFEGMSARGSRVTWAKKPPDANLGWARMQLLATRPEYTGRFSVFMNNLRGGSPLDIAESNAFGKPAAVLEKEAAASLASGAAAEVTTSARPLDPKRDFGEHSIEDALAGVYLADTLLKTNRTRAEEAYKAAGNAGLQALAEEGFALLALADKDDADEYLQAAIDAGSKSAWVFAQAAESRAPGEASTLLMKARELNPRWWIPPARLAEFTEDKARKESFLQEACQKNPRSAELWQQLAEVQTREGKGRPAQNSWIRAEDAAATQEERKAIHAKRQSLENERLDAEQNARRQEAAAARAEDDRLRNDQMARIRAAEQKADEANSEGASTSNGDVLPWWSEGQHPIEGSLVQVDCLGEQMRLILQAASGKKLMLLVPNAAKVRKEGPNAVFACGALISPRKVSVTYTVRADKRLGTAGDVVSVRFE